jgi:hypothetical protein
MRDDVEGRRDVPVLGTGDLAVDGDVADLDPEVERDVQSKVADETPGRALVRSTSRSRNCRPRTSPYR